MAGEGSRFVSAGYTFPKPMIEIGNKPILIHLMEYYARYGHENFFLALGYKGDYIKDIANSLIENKEDALLSKSDDFFKNNAEEYIFNQIKNTLSKIGLKFPKLLMLEWAKIIL